MAEVFGLHWLPRLDDWELRFAELKSDALSNEAWPTLVALANTRMDFVQTNRLDRLLQQHVDAGRQPGSAIATLRLAVLGSSTTSHLLPGLRMAGLRRGLWLECYQCDYGEYWRELLEPQSALRAFAPTDLLFALDAETLTRGFDLLADTPSVERSLQNAVSHVTDCWRIARDTFHCRIYQQTVLPKFVPRFGSNEHRIAGSPHQAVSAINRQLRRAADEFGVDLVAIDDRAAQDGIERWHAAAFWRSAKQEVSVAAAPLYGDLVVRLIAARLGRSFKCLVLDLDNTLWGGVVGDDGLEGIELGQGSAAGEAFVGFQHYLKDMSRRGIILAVCSKNDPSIARSAFETHPEMVLNATDIACFVANWRDKATNIREIACSLNIGLDSMVFFDDSAFERNLVRQLLPMVATPEVPDDPEFYSACLADSGYFEGVALSEEDKTRAHMYRANLERKALADGTSDVGSYLRGLDMELVWGRFDRLNLKRIVQLINKTNQFNLTTRRYSEDEVIEVMDAADAIGLHFRLLDRFGDNGIISIVVGRLDRSGAIALDTWLMSCRVLRREVEQSVLDVVAAEALRMGATRLIGEFHSTEKNEMVREHYDLLGFTRLSDDAEGRRTYELDLARYTAAERIIALRPV